MVNEATDVSLVFPSLEQGGAEQSMVSLANYLSGSGYNVTVVLLISKGTLAAELDPDVEISCFHGSVAGSLPSLVKYVSTQSPDTVISTIQGANIMTALACKLSPSSTTHIIREATIVSKKKENPQSRKERLMHPLISATYPLSDHIVTVSRAVKDDLVSEYDLKSDNISVIYNATVDSSTEELLDEPIDHKWLTDPNETIVVGVGRLAPEKDFDTLTRAFERVSHDDVKLVLIGDGEQRESLERLAEQLSIDDNVLFTGYVENPLKYMAKADVFVLSSRWEGFGNVIVEALFCGTPVVSTDCSGGPREILKDGEIGELVPVGDPEAMSEAIEETIQGEPDVDDLKERALDFSTANLRNYENLIN